MKNTTSVRGLAAALTVMVASLVGGLAPSTSHAVGLAYLDVYTPCVPYAGADSRSDLIGSIPGHTTEEIHWTDLWSTFFDGDLFRWVNHPAVGWDESGWQFDQAALSHYHYSNGAVYGVTAAGLYWTWNWTLQIYTTDTRLDRSYIC